MYIFVYKSEDVWQWAVKYREMLKKSFCNDSHKTNRIPKSYIITVGKMCMKTQDVKERN